MTLQGPDVSSYQGQPDWAAVAASGRSFAWTKATEGLAYTNPDLSYNWPAIKTAGLVRGAYHFGQPAQGSPEDQADFFLGTLGDIQATDLLALDLEAGSGQLLDWALRFLYRVTSQAGFKPMLYSGRWFLDPHGVEANDELAQYGLWLSGYQSSPPALPPGWQTLAMWQFTDRDIIPGISGPCDESVFFGTLDQLHGYGKPGATPQQAPVSVGSQIVTIDSVIGDNTYPDGSDMDALAPNQPVSHRVFIRQLVQYAKTLPGLPNDTVTRLSVIGDNTYPDGGSFEAHADNQPEGVTKRIFIRQLVQQDKASWGA